MNVKQYDGSELIIKLAEELKQIPECAMPEWAMFVKTGVNRTQAPVDPDWWYLRAASILRKISLLGPIGVNKLRRKYGGKYRRGYKPATFTQGSGKIIRVILQQLETAGLAKQIVVSGHKGRVIDTKGIKVMAKAAKGLVVAEAPAKEEAPAKKPKKESKTKAAKKEEVAEEVTEEAK